MSPSLSDAIVCNNGTKQLHCPGKGTVYRALSADASTVYGLSPVLTVFDELGQVRGPRSELFEALETATAGQLRRCRSSSQPKRRLMPTCFRF
jgi:hypothetical protein